MEDSETQMGGSVNTRGMKRERVEQESPRQNDKETKVKGEKRKTDGSDMSELLDDGLDQFLMKRAKRLEMEMNPPFRADLVFISYKRHALKEAVKKEQFIVISFMVTMARAQQSSSLFSVLIIQSFFLCIISNGSLPGFLLGRPFPPFSGFVRT